jgi:hypothetical protein
MARRLPCTPGDIAPYPMDKVLNAVFLFPMIKDSLDFE